jgi:carboxymethylenebutenolidase
MADGAAQGNVRTEWTDLSVADGTTMPAYIARPAGDGSHPGLMVFQEAFGVNEHIRDVAERFALAGYTSIAPALFHRTDPQFEGSYTDFSKVMPHMQAVTDEGLIADVTAAHEWLSSPTGGNATVIASIGYCMGGRVSFLADAVLPIQASVSFYGGGIAPNPQGRPSLLGRAPDLHAPILLIWGGLDGHIGPDQRNAIEAALTEVGKEYVNVVFSKADHGFFCDARASYNPCASTEAQALTLAFLSTNLKH